MTLIANEINYDPARKGAALFVCASDRRISVLGRLLPPRRKIYAVDGLSATISFFGLLHYNAGGDSFDKYLAKLKCLGRWKSVEEFSKWLQLQLNAIVDKHLLRSTHSGFHIAGFDTRGVPEMWLLTNIGGVDPTTLSYNTFRASYDLSERIRVDCATLFDAASNDYIAPISYVFANGDPRGFVACWRHLANMEHDGLRTGLATHRFLSDSARRMYCKMEQISVFYRLMAAQSIVGKPIDVFKVRATGVSNPISYR